MTTPPDLPTLDALHARCTPGPLQVNRYDNNPDISYQIQSEAPGLDDLETGAVLGSFSDEETPRARWDAEFFVAISNAYPALSARIRELEAERRGLVDMIVLKDERIGLLEETLRGIRQQMAKDLEFETNLGRHDTGDIERNIGWIDRVLGGKP